MLTKEYIVMLLIRMDLQFIQPYVHYIWFVQRNLRNLSTTYFIYCQGELPMKNLAIRTFVVALAVAGFSASSMYSATAARNNEAKVLVAHPGVVRTPTPLCNPGSTCGLD